MPKSKVRKKSVPAGAAARRSPGKVRGPSNPIYVVVMFGFMLAGLVWVLLYYLAGGKISWMSPLGAYNFLIASGLAVIGLLMTLRWR
jgi:hypothetical protein